MGRYSVDDDNDDDDYDDYSEDEMSLSQENTLDLRREQSSSLPSRPLPFGHHISHGNRFVSDQDIYLDHDENHPNPSNEISILRRKEIRTRHRGYFTHILLLLLLILLQHYAPPPIPPFDSWSEYISHSVQGFTSTVTNLTALGYYVASGCFRNMKEDGVAKIYTLLSSTRIWSVEESNAIKLCPIMIPIPQSIRNTNTNTNHKEQERELEQRDVREYIRDQIVAEIVGQDSSIDSISNALAAWSIQMLYPNQNTDRGDPTHTEQNPSLNTSKRRAKPMNIVLAGPDGVGKYETTKQIANLFLNACQDDDVINASTSTSYINRNHDNDNPSASCACDATQNSERTLYLQGIDFALEEGGGGDGHGNHSKHTFIDRILRHIYKYNGAGAVIVIRHVEHVSRDAKQELIRLLTKSSVSVSFLPPNSNTNPATSLWKRLDTRKHDHSSNDGHEHDRADMVDVRLDNCVFLFTTDVGADKIFGGLRSYGIKDPSLLDKVHKAVEGDVISHFDDVKLFNAVVPFWPLQYTDMKEIWIRKLSTRTYTNQKHQIQKQRQNRYMLELEDSALEYLAGPHHIEYIEMKLAGWAASEEHVANGGGGSSTEDNGSIIFAKSGGHDLFYDYVLEAIEEKLNDDSSFHGSNEFVRIGYDGDEMQLNLKLCFDGGGDDGDSIEHIVCIDKGIITIAR